MRTARLPCLLPMALLASLTFLAACGGHSVRSTTFTPLDQETAQIAEAQLLDVGVLTFDPGLDNGDEDTLLPEVRKAEGHYLARQLTETIQSSASWGAVRMIPSTTTVTDVYVEGTILQSDGETLEIAISVSDTSGAHWYKKTYKEQASKYAYERRRSLQRDPFQGLFNQISNDLLEHRRELKGAAVENLRSLSALRFARDFSPETYAEHIRANRKGILEIARLPAANDPTMARIQRMRERDYLYVDTLQEYYGAFAKRMEKPYQTWRAQSYDEVIAARELKRQSVLRTAGGVAAVLAGIAAQTSDNRATRTAGAVGIGTGAMVVKSGLSKRAEAQIHIEALAELGQSLEAEIEPQVIELEDRTITLTGNVEAQYQQWKELLHQMYVLERGEG